MAKKALIVYGGWFGHKPAEGAAFFRSLLEPEGFEVEMSESLESFADLDHLKELNLIIPHWTVDVLTPAQRDGVISAVRDHGVGIAGCHGGMGDAFRLEPMWQFMVGGQFVAHPGDQFVTYPVRVRRGSGHPIVDGIADFEVKSEQYYMHVDPGITVLATTPVPTPGFDGPHVDNPCDMPVVWVKRFGAARVFYATLGHFPEDLMAPEPREIMRRGFVWAAKP